MPMAGPTAAPLRPSWRTRERKPFEPSRGWDSATVKSNAPSHEFHTPSPRSSRSSARRFASSLPSNSTPYRSGVGAVVHSGPHRRLPRAHSPDAEHHVARRPHQPSGRSCGVARDDIVLAVEPPPDTVVPRRTDRGHQRPRPTRTRTPAPTPHAPPAKCSKCSSGSQRDTRDPPYLSSPIHAPPHARPSAIGAVARAKSTPIGAASHSMNTSNPSVSTAAAAGSSSPCAELARATR